MQAASNIQILAKNKEEKYKWVDNTLLRLRYFSVNRNAKGEIRKYIAAWTGYSNSQITRLIAKKKKFGTIMLSLEKKNSFPKKYAANDIALLIKTDNAHNRLSAAATKKILQREYKDFGKKEYENIRDISLSHIYNHRLKILDFYATATGHSETPKYKPKCP